MKHEAPKCYNMLYMSHGVHLQFFVECLRYNERILREINQEQNSTEFRQRASRLEKWKLAARTALASSKEDVPEKLESLAFDLHRDFLMFLIL